MPSRTTSKQDSASSTKLSKLPPLKADVSFESAELLRACIPAHRALSAFEQCCRQSTIADAACDVFAWLNAAAAWQLEGTPISLRELLLVPTEQRNAQVSCYIAQAQSAALRLSHEPVGSVLALELATKLSDDPVTVRRGDSGASTTRIISAPPVGSERLQLLLENWQEFVQQGAGSIDSLLIAAAAHGQWMAMRPFTHANTATGQLLVSLLMIEEGLITKPVLPVTHTFAKNSDNYWKHLNDAISIGRRDIWLHHFLMEIESAAIAATHMMMAWQQHLDALAEQLPALLPKTPSAALVRLCGSPSFGISDLADAGIPRRQTATAWMQRLVDAGLLKEGRAGKEKRYSNPVLIDLILNPG